MRRRGRNNFRHHHSRLSKRKYSSFSRMSYFTRKHPIATGIILIIVSIILFRLSFTNAFLSSSEIFMWSVLLSIGLFLTGTLVLMGYWKNHVSMLTTRHNVRWR